MPNLSSILVWAAEITLSKFANSNLEENLTSHHMSMAIFLVNPRDAACFDGPFVRNRYPRSQSHFHYSSGVVKSPRNSCLHAATNLKHGAECVKGENFCTAVI